jgi:hypothetical protein
VPGVASVPPLSHALRNFITGLDHSVTTAP